jgi:DNA-binding transcriptional ArsR family regulator
MGEVRKKKMTRAEKMAALDLLFEGLGVEVSARQILSLKNMTYATDEQRRAVKKFGFKQKIFIKAYEETYGNITASCRVAGIHRQTYYLWRKRDKAFSEYLDSLQIEEAANDLNEAGIIKLIKDGNPYVTVYRARAKMKHRGYIDNQDTNAQGSSVENVHWYLPDNGRDQQETIDIPNTDVTEKKDNQDKGK